MSTAPTTRRERGAPSKIEKVVASLAAYHAAAKLDATLPLDLTKVARRCGCSDDTLRNYRRAGESAVVVWLGRLEALKEARAQEEAARRALDEPLPGPSTAAVAGERHKVLSDEKRKPAQLAALSDAALERRIVQRVEMAKTTMLRFVAQCRRDRVATDVERASFDLGECLSGLTALSADIASFAGEVKTRRRAVRAGG